MDSEEKKYIEIRQVVSGQSANVLVAKTTNNPIYKTSAKTLVGIATALILVFGLISLQDKNSKASLLVPSLSHLISDTLSSTPSLSLDKNNYDSLALASQPTLLNSLASSLYTSVSNFFSSVSRLVSSLLGLTLTPREVVVEPTPVSPVVTNNNSTTTVINQTVTPTQIIRTTNVVERTVEKSVPADISRAEVDLLLNQLQNKLISDMNLKLSNFSSTQSSPISSLYQQIANSQRIDNLYNTNISNPIITGGSITGTSISATSLSAGSLSVSGSATSTSNVGFNITSGCYAISGSCLVTYGDTNVNSFIHSSTTIPKTYTANTYTALQSFNYSSSTIYSSFVTASTTNLVVNGQSFNNLLGSGLLNTSNALTLDTTFLNNTTNSYIHASTTIPKTYTANTFTSLQTFNASASSTGFSANYASFGGTATTTFTQAGFVGVGTTSPSQTFSVLGNGYITGGLGLGKVNTVAGSLETSAGVGVGTILSLRALLNCNSAASALQSDGSGNVNCGNITAIGGTSAGGWTFINPNTVRLATTTDIVGIGTTTPYAKLSLNSGGVGTTTLAIGGVVGQTANLIDIYDSNSNLTSVYTASGKLGIGTTSPGSILSVQGVANFSTATSTFYSTGGINLTGGCFSVNGTCTTDLANAFIHASTTIPKTYTANTFTGLQIFTNSSTTLGSFTYASTTNLVVNGQSFNSLLGSGLLNTSNALTLDTTFLNNTTNSFIHASTTIPKTYTANVFSALQTFAYSSSTSYTSFNTASTTNLIINGSSFNNLLGSGLKLTSNALTLDTSVANTWTALQQFGNASTTLSSAYSAFFGGTATSTFNLSGQLSLANTAINSILSINSAGLVVGTSTPTFGNFNATSTVATSTISTGGFTVGTSQFVVQENSGNVGVGTTTPQYLLNSSSATAPQLALSAGAGVAQWTFRNAGGNLYLSTTTVAGTSTTTVAALNINGTTGTATFGDGTYKIDVGTVDPPYIIDGTRYATYLSGMVGVKEEVTGVVKLSRTGTTGDFSYTIDFNTQSIGSDLWIFSKVTDWGQSMEKLIVLTSASHPQAKVWYTKDPNSNKLTIYGNGNFEVSYRLTAPRFDSDGFLNRPLDQDGGGFHPNDANFSARQAAASSDIIILNNNPDSTNNSISDFLASVYGEIRQGVLAFAKLIVDNLTVKNVEVQEALILHSQNGSCFKVNVNNEGGLNSTSVPCPNVVTPTSTSTQTASPENTASTTDTSTSSPVVQTTPAP